MRDPSGDAPATSDIGRTRLTNGRTAFVVTFRVRKLPRTGTFVVGAGLAGWGRNYRVVKTRHGARVFSRDISEVDVYPERACRTAHLRWNRKKHLVSATLPYDCDDPTHTTDESIINGVDFRAGRARDSVGHVFYAIS